MLLEKISACWDYFIKAKLPEKSKSSPKCRFPLLQLPRVVLLECIENLDVLEIIQFSLLSKRAKSIAKLIRWSPLNIRLLHAVDGSFLICLRLSTDPGVIWFIAYSNQKKSSGYPYFQSSLFGPKVNHFLFQWCDGSVIEDIKQMVGHICEVFCSSINGIDIVEQSLIEWIIKFQPTIPHVWIMKGVITSSESLDHTLKNLKVTEHLGLQSTAIDERFEITNPISSRFITIDGSNWITLPSILNGNNSVIVLNDSMLTPMDINTILKEWQKGSKLQNLEYMRIYTTTLLDAESYITEAFKDLNFTDDVGNDERPTTVERDDERTQTLPETDMVFNLIRSDGMILSIFGHYDVFEDEKIDMLLHLQVWRPQV
ncbi:hypothetical protein B9Z55_012311 [Caenorhabditis nigoni]|nr:hypothetical protein B9Z55_012311 [Caenorhabditis nigoni]